MIRLSNVHKSFGKSEVLRGISADFADGAVTAILGPSGFGKSTLIRCINGLEEVSGGDITVNDLSVRNRRHLGEIRRQCAMVFQQFNLYPHLTVMDNITLSPIKVLRRDRAQAEGKALELLERVAMADRGHSYPSELSGGQQQRVAICRALAMDPAHVLLDEVTSALDPEMTAEVLDTIEGLAQSGTTMLMVTHEIAFARRICEHVAFLDERRLIAHQAAEVFFGSGQDERIARFLTRMTH